MIVKKRKDYELVILVSLNFFSNNLTGSDLSLKILEIDISL